MGDVARLARGAADWLIDGGSAGGSADPGDPSLYHGLAGVVLALHEAYKHFGDDRYRSEPGSRSLRRAALE